MKDHRKAHARWRRLLPKHAAWLVEQIHARIVPEFERRGFVWYPDFARGDPFQIGANTIPLQRREGAEWPTVELRLDGRRRPWFVIEFGLLPPVCRRHVAKAPYDLVDVPREEAVLVDAPEYFILCRGERRSLDCEFGYRWFSLFPRRFLGRELEKALSLLPHVFATLDGSISRERIDAATWPFGKVAEHVALAGGRRVEERLRRERGARDRA